MKDQYNKEIKAKEKQIEAANNLLLDVNHPEFNQRVVARNALTVDLEILRQKNTGTWRTQNNVTVYKTPINL